MKKSQLLIPLLFMVSILLQGCDAIGDIFKAGVWVGIILVIAIIAVIGFLYKVFKK